MPFCARRSRQIIASWRWPWEQRFRKCWTIQELLGLELMGDLRMGAWEEKKGIAGEQHQHVGWPAGSCSSFTIEEMKSGLREIRPASPASKW